MENKTSSDFLLSYYRICQKLSKSVHVCVKTRGDKLRQKCT